MAVSANEPQQVRQLRQLRRHPRGQAFCAGEIVAVVVENNKKTEIGKRENKSVNDVVLETKRTE